MSSKRVISILLLARSAIWHSIFWLFVLINYVIAITFISFFWFFVYNLIVTNNFLRSVQAVENLFSTLAQTSSYSRNLRMLNTYASRQMKLCVNEAEELSLTVKELFYSRKDWLIRQLLEGEPNKWFHRNILGNSKSIDCQICMQNLPSHLIVKYSRCNHSSCITCHRKYLEECLNSGSCEFECPFGLEECEKFGQKEIKRASKYNRAFVYRLEKAYLRHGLKTMPGDYYECPTADCTNVMYSEHQLSAKYFQEGDAYKIDPKTGCDLRCFDCPECKYSHCLLCHRVWTFGKLSHDSISCAEYKKERRKSQDANEDTFTKAEIEKGIENDTLRRCPKCKIAIEKKWRVSTHDLFLM
mmetsp:Transcript_17194/g.22482  ORF Transcript_17194/g.22482 Transcript_17194/m.22482 type:complete len:356 (-) Transcript_17194:1595-2662(-)